MKTITCYDCDSTFQSESRDDMLKQLYDHYMKTHTDIITGATEEEKKAWMEQFEKDWQTA